MVNIMEAASEVLKQDSMKNISELEKVPVDVELLEEQRENNKGETYTVRYIQVEGEKFRVPFVVLKQLEEIKKKRPDLKEFCVSRKGTTKEDTVYTVVAL